MKAMVENLFALQQLLLRSTRVTADQEAKIRQLRKDVPLPILGHFERIVKQGRKGVALVRHGVCCECHVRVSAGTAASLIRPKDVYLCESCGRYLLLDPAEAPEAIEVPAGKPARKSPAGVA
jgi:predicted  nucleic acid-binding Zn-ribbon protein